MMVIERTKAWLKEVVIGLGLCPFAFEVYNKNLITYHEVPFHDAALFLSEFSAIASTTIKNEDQSTSLIIIPEGLEQFEDYLSVFAVLESYLIEQNLDSEIQMASFHPLYCFEGTQEQDPENYTNRSPYPIIHLLKVAAVEAAIESHPDITRVPKENIALMKKIGRTSIVAIIDKISW